MSKLPRREFVALGLAGAAGMMLRHRLSGPFGQIGAQGSGHNVLFIPVDDLRPTIGCYEPA